MCAAFLNRLKDAFGILKPTKVLTKRWTCSACEKRFALNEKPSWPACDCYKEKLLQETIGEGLNTPRMSTPDNHPGLFTRVMKEKTSCTLYSWERGKV